MTTHGAAATTPGEARWPALDGLRGLAILFVLVYHFGGRLEPGTLLEHGYRRLIALGWSGVDLFFVLSGFLITGILVDARDSAVYFRAFYARRALRIFPLYYAFVFGYVYVALPRIVGDTSPMAALTENRGWFLLFGSNILISLRDTLTAAPYYTSALWSLAVEEQFYLWWPLLVAVCPPGRLGRVCLWTAVLAAVFRGLVFAAGFNWGAAYLMPARMDTLALGGWLAVQLRANPGVLARVARPMCVGAGSVLATAWLLNDTFAYSEISLLRTASFSVFAVFYAGLVGCTLLEPGGQVARLCSFRWLRMFGFYSFGMYIWHNPIRLLLDLYGWTPQGLAALGLSGLAAVILYSASAMSLTTVAAVVSWTVLEAPFNRLKRHIPYRPHPATRAALAAG